MKSNIQQYDEALLDWVEEDLVPAIPDKPLQILFAPPDRAYAERVDGRYVVPEQLRLPRVTLARLDFEFADVRYCHAGLRKAGYVSDAKLAINTAGYPIPINIPYQLSWWVEYETEAQALYVTFMRAFRDRILHRTVFINQLFQNKIIPYFMEATVSNETNPEPGNEFREIRYVAPLRCEGWIFDDTPVEVKTVREIIAEVRDLDTSTLWSQSRVVTPQLIGEGTGLQTDFTATLNAPVMKPSVVVFSVVSGSEVRGFDDGDAGAITGDGVSGTIDYVTGSLSISFTSPPDVGAGVYVEYQEDNS